MKQQRVALPKTYHQRALAGTMCFISGPTICEAPVRSSMNLHAVARDLSISVYLGLRLKRCQGDGAGLNLDLAVIYPHGVARERFGGRPGGDRPVLVIRPAMARAHEQPGALHPADRASQVAAVDAEGDEFGVGDATEPGRGLGGDAGPGERRGVREVDLHGLADGEGVD